MRHVSFKNWKRHQHYTDRKPPWIKLYTNFHETTSHLTNDARLLACLLFCVAANKDNKIPDDPRWLSVEVGMTRAQVTRGLDELFKDGMLVYADELASEPASDVASKTDSETARPSRAPAPSREAEAEAEAERNHIRSVPSASTHVPLVDGQLRADIWAVLDELAGKAKPGTTEGYRRKAHVDELITQHHATPDEIRRRAANYPSWVDRRLTVNGLLLNWTNCDTWNDHKPQQPAKESRDQRIARQIREQRERWGLSEPIGSTFMATDGALAIEAQVVAEDDL